ncbi:uncharacterized protein LOC120205088 isoform X2 [Hibiscus syriacus]|uniref:uncharacterized protein LOC120205088 isoform X2 n=1 Tax=Hibiscus syriacus TaxID=106335 RepID=UPI0019239D42|nr:uncharacterized protein LOC120205088 isoform X2 [Hibiscus syriacus]
MSEDEWVKQALTDSTLAAKALLSLFRSESPPPRSASATSQALQLEWSVRQRRSKQFLKKKAEQARASPNTPLCWSGGVSVSGSGSGDGSEESSRPPLKPVENARSKVATTKEITPPKRSRRKRELEIAKLRFENIRTENETLSRKLESEKERATEESSKRTKFDYHPAPQTAVEPNDAISKAPPQREVTSRTSILRTPNGCSEGQDTATASCNETSFGLPDLNLPVEVGLG